MLIPSPGFSPGLNRTKHNRALAQNLGIMAYVKNWLHCVWGTKSRVLFLHGSNIVLKFYKAESGEMVINGNCNSDHISLKDWRSKIGIIPQEIHIFNGTILQNILSELTESKFNAMTSAISDYGLDMFINRFPSGLLTLVGEEGINLSGGEKQLLAFIRVLINKPDLLIIDEGTSFMDRGTESTIMNLLKRLKTEMGILLISHRINIVRNLSDEICILEDKVITHKGTHSELRASDNLYRRFWDDFY